MWSIEVNAVVINNDGNLIDAVYLSVLLSLLHFRKPQVQILAKDELKVYAESERKL